MKIMDKVNSLDQKILLKINKYSENLLLDIISFLGNIIIVFLVILVIFFLPIEKGKEISIISIFSYFLSTLFVFIIKFSVKRKRYANDEMPLNNLDPYSFPSGHVSRLSGLIITMSPLIYLQLLFGILAISISLSRMIKGYHYLSDCVVGFLIGILSGAAALLFSGIYVPIILDIISKFV